MCHVHASTDPRRDESTTRSVRLQGSVASVRLENELWEILDELAQRQGMSAAQFISKLYAEVIEEKGAVPDLASVLRVACAVHLHLRSHATPPLPDRKRA